MQGFVKRIELDRDRIPSTKDFPFSIPSLRNFNSLELHPQITYFVGENGSGKSTLLEAMAIAANINAEGGSKNFQFSTRKTHSSLGDYIRLVRGTERERDGYFFRAESFYNLATYADLEEEDPWGAPIVETHGGISLHEQSHGESFFSVFMHRLGGRGLYLFDEPEAALSPIRQMSALSRFHDLIQQQSQLVIATHSPILMAYPGAKIYHFSEKGIIETKYEMTEHYKISFDFFNRREKILRELFRD